MSQPLEQTIAASRGSAVYVYVISIIAALGGLLYGFILGVVSGAGPFFTEAFKLTPDQVGLVVGNVDIGGMFGALFAGVLSDRFGRKKILILTAVLFAFSGVLTALATSLAALIIGRLVGGFAVGASLVSALYIAEVAPAKVRGFLVTLVQFGIVIGILLTYVTNWMLVDIGPDNWRWMFGVGIIPAAVFLFGLFFVPESPRWLAQKGMVDKALDILTRIGGDSHARSELREIQATVDSGEKGSVWELFRPGLRTALIIGVLISIFAQSVGINTVIYYAPIIFMKAGSESASAALFANIAVGVINFLFTIIAIVTIDRFGRKPLLLIGLAGMALAMTSTGILFQSAHGGAMLVLIPILAFVALYALSIGPIAWVIVSEIFPNRIRGAAMAISMIALYISDFFVSLKFPWMIDTMGNGTFFFFAGICVLAFLFVWFMVVETKGKSLEEIERMWEKA
jgi:MFS transporter, SP family, arabinose:H+ symporter